MSDKKQIVLVQLIGSKKPQTFDIEQSEFVIGRGDTSAVPVHDHGISREHIKVRLVGGIIQIQDLNSSNGTFVNDVRIISGEPITIGEFHVVTLGLSLIKIKFKVVEIGNTVQKEIEVSEKENEAPPIFVDISAFPKTADDFKVEFKNVGLKHVDKKEPKAQALEIIKEAEYIKHSIIKSAEVLKNKTIHETKVQTRKAAEEARIEYQNHVDMMLEDARVELNRLKVETEIMLDEKRIQANEEIQNAWQEHEEQVRAEKDKIMETIEKENRAKLELSIEKMKSTMFADRNRMITDTEGELLQKKRAFQVEMENEKTEHLSRIKLFSEELSQIQKDIEESTVAAEANRNTKQESDIELSRVLSQLKQEQEILAHVQNQHRDIVEMHKKIETEVAEFAERKKQLQTDFEKAIKEREEVNKSYTSLSERRQQVEEQLHTMSRDLNEAKKKAKLEIDQEYRELKEAEVQKLTEYKAHEAKELQKIRDQHLASIKKLSVDLSLEIATKLELLAKKSEGVFDFEKNLELINSVIQVKSAIDTGTESKHVEQLKVWKERKEKESFGLQFRGLIAGLVLVFVGNFAYKKLNTDPVQLELAKMAVERKQKEIDNIYVPQKIPKYHDNYVDATLLTEQFTETYLDDAVQQEWVKYSTRYFLRQWKVEEEKVIQVVANSRALVQAIDESKGTLKKDRIKLDFEKLKAMEQENIEKQASILGTNVKYEAYKKLEKEFFLPRVQKRIPASQ